MAQQQGGAVRKQGRADPQTSEERSVLREGTLTLADGLALQMGGRVAPCRIAWRLLGPAGGPVVATLGGISADRHVCAAPGTGEPNGWWQGVAGLGGALDPERWRILSIDFVAGPGGSSAPPQPPSGVVPLLTPGDQANALCAVMDHLHVGSLHAVIGASYGGAVALAFAADHAERTASALVIGAAHQSHPMATAVRVVQRRIVADARARGDERGGLGLARALAMTTYRSQEEFNRRFSGHGTVGADGLRFPVEDYLDHHGRVFAERFDTASFLCLSQSMDLQDIDPARVRAPVTLVAMVPDAIAPAWQVRELHERLGRGHRIVEVATSAGHDGFLTDVETFREVLANFLLGSGDP